MKQRFSIDRIEDDIAVCYDEACQKYLFSASLLGLRRGDLFEATLKNGVPTEIIPLREETAAARQEGKRRLDALFARRKHQK